MRVGVARALANSSDFRLLEELSSQKFDSLPWTPTNRRAKFDAASFILGGKIRNRTNTQKTQTIYPHLAYRHVWVKKQEVQLPQRDRARVASLRLMGVTPFDAFWVGGSSEPNEPCIR